MGLQDRDYYREKLEKIERGNFEKFDWKKFVIWFVVFALIISLVVPLIR